MLRLREECIVHSSTRGRLSSRCNSTASHIASVLRDFLVLLQLKSGDWIGRDPTELGSVREACQEG